MRTALANLRSSTSAATSSVSRRRSITEPVASIFGMYDASRVFRRRMEETMKSTPTAADSSSGLPPHAFMSTIDKRRYGRLPARRLPSVIQTEEENQRLIKELTEPDSRCDRLSPEESAYADRAVSLPKWVGACAESAGRRRSDWGKYSTSRRTCFWHEARPRGLRASADGLFPHRHAGLAASPTFMCDVYQYSGWIRHGAATVKPTLFIIVMAGRTLRIAAIIQVAAVAAVVIVFVSGSGTIICGLPCR